MGDMKGEEENGIYMAFQMRLFRRSNHSLSKKWTYQNIVFFWFVIQACHISVQGIPEGLANFVVSTFLG